MTKIFIKHREENINRWTEKEYWSKFKFQMQNKRSWLEEITEQYFVPKNSHFFRAFMQSKNMDF